MVNKLLVHCSLSTPTICRDIDIGINTIPNSEAAQHDLWDDSTMSTSLGVPTSEQDSVSSDSTMDRTTNDCGSLDMSTTRLDHPYCLPTSRLDVKKANKEIASDETQCHDSSVQHDAGMVADKDVKDSVAGEDPDDLLTINPVLFVTGSSTHGETHDSCADTSAEQLLDRLSSIDVSLCRSAASCSKILSHAKQIGECYDLCL